MVSGTIETLGSFDQKLRILASKTWTDLNLSDVAWYIGLKLVRHVFGLLGFFGDSIKHYISESQF